MTFPNTALDTVVELFIDDAWTDVTQDVYLRDPITITRGRTAQGDTVDPSRCTVTFNNRDGKYSPRNPNGAYYGKIGRNTPLRVSVEAGAMALDLPGNVGDWAYVNDVAALDVTGDIDVRLDGTISNWLDPSADPSGFHNIELIGKLNASKSWQLSIRNYRLFFEWSANGSTSLDASSTIPLPAGPTTRMAVRATLDVNNGAGGNTVTFYTADRIDGTWTQLGDPVTQSGTTSIFAGTAPLVIGDATGFGFGPSAGKCHAAQVRNGIGGTVVANPDFTAQAAGATSFVDSAGCTWNLGGKTSITNRQVRFVGEVSEWPVEWDVSGEDVYTQVTASGILRRLSQGASPIKSTLTRRLPSLGPLAYWPMEEGKDATQAYSPVAGVRPMIATGFSWAAVDTLDGSSALPTVGTNTVMRGVVPRPSGSPSTWQVEFVVNLSSVTSTLRSVMRIASSGTVREWVLQIATAEARIYGTNEEGGVVLDTYWTVGSDLYDGRWNRWKFDVKQDGSNVDWQMYWLNVGGSGGIASGTFAGTTGRVLDVHSPEGGYSADLQGMAIGHVAVFSPSQLNAFNSVDTGLRGETAGTRMTRLTAEEDVPFALWGDPSIQAQVGPQRPAAMLDILRNSAEADGGILYEQREAAGLIYRDASSLFNQRVRLALDYEAAGHVAPPFAPSDDDQYIRNEVTVTRTNGGAAVASVDSGPLSTQAPPDGVGRYQDSQDVNLYDDDQTEHMANWLAFLGTWDEARYPSVHVDLAAGPSLIDDATAVDVGDRATVANLPAWLPPDDIDLMVQGYSEVIGMYAWDITYNCTPGGPWGHIAQVGTARADTAGSELATSATSSATTLYVDTTSGPDWVDSIANASDFPFDIIVAGERMTVTACTGNAVDDFSVAASGSWGTADVGGAWATSGGNTSDYSVASGRASHLLTSLNTSRRSTLTTSFADWDLYTSIRTSALATGSFLAGGLVARCVDINNLYTARAAFNADQTITLTLRKRVAGVETELIALTIPALTHAANTDYRMRFYGSGTSLKAKVWRATDEESVAWDVEATDSALSAAGSVGCRSISNTGNTNVNATVSYDDFVNASPQAMTVTRSVNWVTKGQNAAAAVRLFAPAYVPYL